MRKRTVRNTLPAALLCGALAFSLSGCGEEGSDGREITGSLARNSAAEAGELAFDQAGHEIDGDLTCVDEGSGTDLTVTCEGTTVDGGDAEMVAEAGDNPEITTDDNGVRFDGFSVVGRVDGEQVFEQGCIGIGC
ncbi:hypothetical protein V1L54_13885 [Streptomyces sp. TRM 70361]|uniref:hypothetical protein n=1 Tax=Streptomyces sp. TRM 70361 TaxID=3116553 RepID=UPI002E7B0B7C|nr:hypothetical protein [Streptomyces sp. TRM 70361]MEE1940485.1 hypothetical protein [Streptomyces sp. TRM 70361]